ncbi:putative endonuclease [Mariprofundus ferrinatatus]|uniref:Putative endonuclease n=1 Tax=Mariprofundus ferrinatatus TaxID=1921087 RepID=A0A2K8L7M3_9PROT|nr:GIY-YIG nuclease family protein [Mariprofundus ferrinatatus]ATX82249.1 putative endonuclease [Mariprofundus ferrinatatus]
MPESEGGWFLYLVRCSGGQLYTGITTDVDRRFEEHCSGKGAKFLRGKGPLQLVFSEKVGNHSDALKAEINIKKMHKSAKELLVQRGCIG